MIFYMIVILLALMITSWSLFLEKYNKYYSYLLLCRFLVLTSVIGVIFGEVYHISKISTFCSLFFISLIICCFKGDKWSCTECGKHYDVTVWVKGKCRYCKAPIRNEHVNENANTVHRLIMIVCVIMVVVLFLATLILVPPEAGKIKLL